MPADLMLVKLELLAKIDEVRARTQLLQWMLGVSLTIQSAMSVNMLVP